jgi:hypothetical protein
MISAQTLRVCHVENRLTLFRIMLWRFSGERPMSSCVTRATLDLNRQAQGTSGGRAEAFSMDSAELAWRLERARNAVAESETDIRCQRDLIFRLERAREDTTEARALLKVLFERQAVRQKNLSVIARQLSPEN